MKQTIVLGNICTLDEKRPHAEAALIKDGTFAFIGDAKTVRELAAEGADVLDYGDNFVYPGFLESHAHPHLAGDRAIGQANLLPIAHGSVDNGHLGALVEDKEVGTVLSWCTLNINSRADNDGTRTMYQYLLLLISEKIAEQLGIPNAIFVPTNKPTLSCLRVYTAYSFTMLHIARYSFS